MPGTEENLDYKQPINTDKPAFVNPILTNVKEDDLKQEHYIIEIEEKENLWNKLKNGFSKIKNEKYKNIYLDSENNLLIETENGKYMPIELLSAGTIDLIYLALRLSATKEISKENLPIILDESFAYYDKERMTQILKYLETLKQYQVLILTCSEREIQILKQEKIPHNIIEI